MSLTTAMHQMAIRPVTILSGHTLAMSAKSGDLPEKPPRSAYHLYSAKVLKGHNVGSGSPWKHVTPWSKLPAADKERYEEQLEKAKHAYKQSMNTLTPQQGKTIAALKKSRLDKLTAQFGEMSLKRASDPYKQFVADKSERMTLVDKAAKWAIMSAQEKKPFEHKAKRVNAQLAAATKEMTEEQITALTKAKRMARDVNVSTAQFNRQLLVAKYGMPRTIRCSPFIEFMRDYFSKTNGGSMADGAKLWEIQTPEQKTKFESKAMEVKAAHEARLRAWAVKMEADGHKAHLHKLLTVAQRRAIKLDD